MTAQGSLEVAVDAVQRGASDFIGKPFDISAVVELLNRHGPPVVEGDWSE